MNIAIDVGKAVVNYQISFRDKRFSDNFGFVGVDAWSFLKLFVESESIEFETERLVFLRFNDLVDVIEIIHKNHFTV